MSRDASNVRCSYAVDSLSYSPNSFPIVQGFENGIRIPLSLSLSYSFSGMILMFLMSFVDSENLPRISTFAPMKKWSRGMILMFLMSFADSENFPRISAFAPMK